MEAPTIPSIEGAVLGVCFGSGDRDYAYIEQPQLEVQAGRLFLTGIYIDYAGTVPSGIRVCIAWDSVTEYYVYESREHYRDCMDKWESAAKTKTWWFRRS